MRRNRTFMDWLLALVLLGACQNNLPEPESHPPFPKEIASGGIATEPLETKSDGPLNLTAEIEGLADPGRYRVRLSWTETTERTPKLGWRVKRSDHQSVEILEPGKQEYFDETVEAGKSYQYRLTSLDMEAGADQVTVSIPQDFVVSGHLMGAQRWVGFNRVFFAADALVETQGAEIQLIAREIISAGGTIQTFSEANLTAEQGQDGKSGGAILIKAQHARGKLTVRGHGQNGGTVAAPTTIPPQAARGANGRTGGLSWTCEEQLRPNQPWIELIDQKKWQHCFACHEPPGSGEPGQPGLPGVSGFSGKNGGDSARITVEIPDAANLELVIDALGGYGGPGSPGGVGGEGGVGGGRGQVRLPDGRETDQAIVYSFRTCYAGGGPSGPRGPEGPMGQRGPTGRSVPAILRLGVSTRGGD